MKFDIQRAGISKRLAAWMFDMLLISVLAVGIGFVLSSFLGYDDYSRTMNDGYARYENLYNVDFDISQEQYEALTTEQKAQYDEAFAAFAADAEVAQAYRMTLNLTLVITTLGLLAACLIWEFAIPLWLGNGQTLGKKIFGLCLMRTDGVKVSAVQLFIRTLLGKFTVETMIPVYILLMIFWGTMGLTGVVILLGLFVAQLVCTAFTRNHTAIHDLMAVTLVVEYASQMIFPTKEDLIAYQKEIAAEQAARQPY